jgi:hypothetical protein
VFWHTSILFMDSKLVGVPSPRTRTLIRTPFLLRSVNLITIHELAWYRHPGQFHQRRCYSEIAGRWYWSGLSVANEVSQGQSASAANG